MTVSLRPSGLARRGAALVLAIILLAGLLLLGLPFLYSQSSSLAGSRSLAHHQQAAVGRDAAEQLGIAVGAEAVRERFLVGGNETATLLTSGPINLNQQSSGNINAYSISLDAAPLAYNGSPINARIVGSVIADEQGKLDVNHLDVAAWSRLLGAVGIKDWDDDAVWDSRDPVDDPSNANDDDGKPGRTGDPLHNGDNDDDDDFGELAEALSQLRFTQPGQKITTIDQLLRADTKHWKAEFPNATDYTNNATVNHPYDQCYGLRRPLTRAELDLLRPYLTVHLLAQGRLGLIDLGSAVAKHPDTNTTFLDSDISDVVRPGTTLAWENIASAGTVDPIRPIEYGAYRAFASLAAANGVYLQGAVMSLGSPTFVADRGFAISAPPAVNLHHAVDQVRTSLASVLALPPGQVLGYGLLDSSTSATTSPYHFLDPLFTGRELPPIDIGSFGVVQIDSAAVANDPQSRAAAQRRRRIYAQAVPQETPLERHWATQGQLHSLVIARYGSNLDTWPQPVARVLGRMPEEVAQGSATAGPVPIGLRPKTLPNLASGWNHRRDATRAQRLPTHLAIDWKLALGSDGLTPASEVVQALQVTNGNGQLQALASPILDTDLRPDGIHVTPGKSLSAVLHPEGNGNGNIPGPLRSVSSSNADLRGRHLSFWLKPDTDFNENKLYPLLETRIPSGSAGDQLNGTRGFSDLQNYLGLFYDRSQQFLVLVIAPPTIEHTHDSWIRTPPDDVAAAFGSLPIAFDIDERCLGGDLGWLPLAPAWPNPSLSGSSSVAPWDETNAKFTTFATRLLKPNRVVHLYKVNDDSTGRPFFREERWCHIQVVLGGDRPGLAQLLVDNIAGRDRSRTPPASKDAMSHGDHLTLPALPLAVTQTSTLPNASILNGVDAQTAPTHGAVLGPIDITIQMVLGLNAADLFPARGMLRIDDEYISYESIEGDTFRKCIRGRRQNTLVNSPTEDERWPNTQQHLPGALVVPGGYRLPLTQGRLFRGGCHLVHELKNGDPAPGEWQTQIWKRVRVDDSMMTPFGTTQMTWPGASGAILPLDPSSGVPIDQFPERGVVSFGGQLLAYEGRSNNELQKVTALNALDGWQVSPAPGTAYPPIEPVNFSIAVNNNQVVHLVGLEMGGANPFDPGRYDIVDESSFDDAPLLQLLHPISGRVEWIRYARLARGPITNSGTFSFAINEAGWFLNPANPAIGTRGRERTDFAGRNNTRLQATDTFPGATTAGANNGTAIIPVQTEIDNARHWVSTGDVVTLRRRAGTISPLPRPIQLLVRYAATDGYDQSGTIAANDTKNGYFAFDRELPSAVIPDDTDPPLLPGIHAINYELLVGPCWSGNDLTPLSPSSLPRGHLPRIDLLGSTSGVLTIAAYDQTSLQSELTALMSAVDATGAPLITTPQHATEYDAVRITSLSATVDAVVAGNLPGILDTTVDIGIVRVANTNGDDLSVGLGAVTQRLVATVPIFDKPMGLITFDGEVLAYRRDSPNLSEAIVVGTGLLDEFTPATLITDHAFPTGTTVNGNIIRHSLPVLPLPIGPVTLVGDPVAPHQWFRFVTDSPGAATSGVQLDAPAVLICSADGDPTVCEIIALSGPIGKTSSSPQPRNGAFFTTAPWLRGQYNTIPNSAGSAGHLAIGWWPRYPSALPPSATQEHFRCRAFSWASFPFSLYGARFDLPASQTLGIAQVAIQPTGTDDLFAIEARAAGAASGGTAILLPDWSTLVGTPLTQPVANSTSASLGDASAAFGSDFTGPVDGAELRVTWHYLPNSASGKLSDIANAANRAPMLGSVRLRALAPAKVLAVEDAR